MDSVSNLMKNKAKSHRFFQSCVSERFFEFGKGKITSKVVGGRVFFFADRSWMSVENELYKRFAGAGAVILREMGATYGAYVAKGAKTTGRPARELVSMLSKLGQAAGWGILRNKGDLARDGRMTVSIRDCIFCSSWNPAESSARGGEWEMQSCQFMVGVVLGAVSELYGPRNEVRETACLRSGSKLCRIEVLRDLNI